MNINQKIKKYLKSKEKGYEAKSHLNYIKFLIRKIIFSSIGIFNYILLKKTEAVPSKEAIILGRGKSVLKYYTNRINVSVWYKTNMKSATRNIYQINNIWSMLKQVYIS